jgi:high-affinity iron transporter
VIALLIAVSASRALGMIGYVAGDYATAVSSRGVILDAEEYREQALFVSEAAQDLQGSGIDVTPLAALIARRAPPADVVPVAISLESQIEAHYQLAILPPRAPHPAAKLYLQACAACHGVDGVSTRADLSTKAPDLSSKDQVARIAPRRIFAAITYGVPGTAMPSYEDTVSAAERWDLAYYVLSLSHSATAELERGRALLSKLPRRPDYLQLAVRSDDQLRKALSGSGLSSSDREAILSACRHFR